MVRDEVETARTSEASPSIANDSGRFAIGPGKVLAKVPLGERCRITARGVQLPFALSPAAAFGTRNADWIDCLPCRGVQFPTAIFNAFCSTEGVAILGNPLHE
jgi:hypothetical protein